MSGGAVYRTSDRKETGPMTVTKRLEEYGQAMDLTAQDLVTAINWFDVRGKGFTVRTLYGGVNQITGYHIKVD